MKKEDKNKKLNYLKELIKENIKELTFQELKVLLNTSSEKLFRESVLETMEKYYNEEYNEWLGDN